MDRAPVGQSASWAGVKGNGVLSGGYGYESPAMTCLHPSELKKTRMVIKYFI